jgi:hypothetical protein
MVAFGFVGKLNLKVTIQSQQKEVCNGRVEKESMHSLSTYRRKVRDGVTPHVISFIVDIFVEEEKLICYISFYICILPPHR